MSAEPNDLYEMQPNGYSAEEVDALTLRARTLLDQLRDVLVEIGEAMTALTQERGGRGGRDRSDAT